MNRGKILVIDDENQLRRALSRIIELEGYEVFQSENAGKAMKILEKEKDILVAICDVKLPDASGLQLLPVVRQNYPHIEVILLTAYGTIHDGVRAMKEGAFDYITKGNGDEQIMVTVEKAVEKAKLRKRIQELENKLETRYSFDRIIGCSRAIKQTIEIARKVAPTDSTVLLQGETGTGKELFAQSIHNESPRRNKPFVAINCSALPGELLESEIFGYRKGAFTGALADKKGLFEEAHEGTLFLDEIGEMQTTLQAKLLRVLEDQSFTKIGDTRVIRVNVRIIAATNRDLLREAGESFRHDLYYRLSVMKIRLPALRERKEDIPDLVDHFIRIYAGKTKKKITGVDPLFLKKLNEFNWPGNTRELKNIIERAVILTDSHMLTPDLLPPEVQNGNNGDSAADLFGTLEDLEKTHIRKMLRHTGGNKTQAAAKLGISVPTLYRKLEQYKLGELF